MPVRRVQQQSGGWAITGNKARTIERMDAIFDLKTMAGSQDADTPSATNVMLLEQRLVTRLVLALDVIEQRAARRHHFQKATA